MTGAEWTEIVRWVNDRFTHGWTLDKATAYHQDLDGYLPEDVFDALYRIYDRGVEFPPNGGQLRKEATEVVRERMARAKLEARGLSAPTEDYGWGSWRDRAGHAGRTLLQAVRFSHGRQYPKGCPFAGCDVCGNLA